MSKEEKFRSSVDEGRENFETLVVELFAANEGKLPRHKNIAAYSDNRHIEVRYHTRQQALPTDVERTASIGRNLHPDKQVYVVFNCNIDMFTRNLVSRQYEVVILDHRDLLQMCVNASQIERVQRGLRNPYALG